MTAQLVADALLMAVSLRPRGSRRFDAGLGYDKIAANYLSGALIAAAVIFWCN